MTGRRCTGSSPPLSSSSSLSSLSAFSSSSSSVRPRVHGCVAWPHNCALFIAIFFRQGEWDDDTWTHRCLYGRLVRAMLVGGPEGRLQREKAWLRDFFVGDPKRLHKVLQVDMSPDAVSD